MKSYAIIAMRVSKQSALNTAEPMGIVRTYEDRERAGEDIDLLRQWAPTDCTFEIVEVEHIA